LLYKLNELLECSYLKGNESEFKPIYKIKNPLQITQAL